MIDFSRIFLLQIIVIKLTFKYAFAIIYMIGNGDKI